MIETLLGVAVVAGALYVAYRLVKLAVWARKNPDQMHHTENPESDLSEDDWSRAIR